jgi:glycine/D-amino acid oxidase-like deaminating enzyme
VPDDGVVYPPVVAAALLDRAKQRGAAISIDTRVKKLEGKRVTLENGDTIECDFAVNAAGVRATDLTPGLPMRPRKGHLAITDRYPNFLRHQLVELGYLKSAHSVASDSVAFNAQPRITGQILIGSSRQFDDTSPEINFALLRRMMARAVEYMPRLAELSIIRTWTGFRAATTDKLPLIGPMPGQDGLWLATGHEGLGITTSLGTAGLLADAMLGRPTQIPIEPYLPSRPQGEHHD